MSASSASESRIFSSYPGHIQTGRLSDECALLLDEQRRDWPMARDGYASLEAVKTRTIQCAGFNAVLQFNPKRMFSTAAKVDPKSIGERKCFLCVENLPPQQRAIAWGNDYYILVNPAPIFRRHFTISRTAHVPQMMVGGVESLLSLAADLSPGFSLFYNGPRCGASAPDHMHFQASPLGSIPIEWNAGGPDRREQRAEIFGVPLFTLQGYSREVFVMESKSKEHLAQAADRLFGAMGSPESSEEPMFNVIASSTDDLLRLIIFPRSKHRPDVYFKEGADRILVSPAAVDIGGLIVTPREEDFNRIDAAMVEAIYKEVSIDAAEVDRIVKALENQ